MHNTHLMMNQKPCKIIGKVAKVSATHLHPLPQKTCPSYPFFNFPDSFCSEGGNQNLPYFYSHPLPVKRSMYVCVYVCVCVCVCVYVRVCVFVCGRVGRGNYG